MKKGNRRINIKRTEPGFPRGIPEKEKIRKTEKKDQGKQKKRSGKTEKKIRENRKKRSGKTEKKIRDNEKMLTENRTEFPENGKTVSGKILLTDRKS